MRRLALRAQERLRERHGTDLHVHLYKNNADSAGHSFGCHENYLVRRYVPLTMIEQQLLPFLITRQIFTGAGRMTSEGFQITQRADFLDEGVSSATTRARPMVNTRDEPHADPDAYRRLHVIIGDSNRIPVRHLDEAGHHASGAVRDGIGAPAWQAHRIRILRDGGSERRQPRRQP